jgi:hypothetical protein
LRICVGVAAAQEVVQVGSAYLDLEGVAVGPEQVEQRERVGTAGNADQHAAAGRQQAFAFQEGQHRVLRV